MIIINNFKKKTVFIIIYFNFYFKQSIDININSHLKKNVEIQKISNSHSVVILCNIHLNDELFFS